MRKEGNRNFGVWNPPTGMDSVRRSTQVDLDLIIRLNNPKIEKELGVRQSFGKSLERITTPDTDTVVFLNNYSLKVFGTMEWHTRGSYSPIQPTKPVFAKGYPPNPVAPVDISEHSFGGPIAPLDLFFLKQLM